MHHGRGTDRAGRAQRVAQRDSAAHRVDLAGVEIQILDDGKGLRGKRLVQFDPVHVLLRQARRAQSRGNRLLRTDTHDLGRHAAHGERHETGERREVELLENLLAHDEQRAGTIRRLRTVAGRDRPLVREDRTQFAEPFDRRIRPRAFVERQRARLDRHVAGGQIREAFDDLDRRDLVREFARLLRLDRLLVGGQREGVLRVARHAPLLRHLLGGQPHAVRDAHVLVALEDRRRERRRVAHHRHHAHALDTPGEHCVGFAHTNAVRRHRERREARGAETVDGHPAHRVRQTREQRADTRHVQALLGFGNGTADDGVLDDLRIEIRHLRERTLENGREQVVRTRVLVAALGCLADRRARGGNDVGVLQLFAHVSLRSA